MSNPFRSALFACAAALLAGAASAAVVAYDYVTLEVPDGWSRLDERAMAVFASPDGALTVTVLTRLGDDDPDDALESFVEAAEAGDRAAARGEAEEVHEEPFELWRQETATRLSDGRIVRRLYESADAAGTATIVAVSGEQAAWDRDGADARAMLASLFVAAPDAAPPPALAVDALPGDGGIEGLYMATGRRSFLAAATRAWTEGERTEVLLFDPLGEVYRGAPRRLDATAFEACAGAQAWRCGRYRIEGAEINLRWADGTTERRTFAEDGVELRLGGRSYRRAPARGANPEGLYEARDDFNAGLAGAAGAKASVRFQDDGRILIEGFESFRAAHAGGFASGASAGGRFKVDGRSMSLVYVRGASEVLGFAEFPDSDGALILLGGMVFERR